MLDGNWDAAAFFKPLLEKNKLANEFGFTFCRVSGLEGFEEALSQSLSRTAFFCVSDTADGYTELDNTPRTRRVKTVFIAMRHPLEDMAARQRCMDVMRELFRQLMSVLLLEKTRIQQNSIFIDSHIAFNEIDRFFAAGCACAFFQIAVDAFANLAFNPNEWLNP